MKKVISISLFVLFISFCMVTIPHSTNAAANADIKMTTTDIGVLDESLQEELLLLSKNSIVIVLSEEDGWSKVQYKTNIGFIRSDNLKKANAQYMLVQSKNEPFVRVTNVQQSDIKGTLYLNSIVEMYSMDSSDFAFVRYGHLAGYVNKHALVKPSEKTMIVKEAKGLVVRSSASPSGEEIGQLVKNTQVKMLTNLKGWAFVTTNEVSGYVLTSGLKTGETKPAASNNKPKTQPKKPVGSGSSLGSKKIALTFDDGPHPKVTLQILKTLEKYDAKATFFVVGQEVKKNPKVLKAVYDAGHEIGNHTYSHAKLTTLSTKQIRTQIESTDAAIKAVTGHNSTVFRPPYGAYNKTVLSQLNVPNVLWTVDTLDWKHHDQKKTLQAVKQNAKNGSIILMHDIHQTTANSLDSVLSTLQKQGYEFVTVSEILEK